MVFRLYLHFGEHCKILKLVKFTISRSQKHATVKFSLATVTVANQVFCFKIIRVSL